MFEKLKALFHSRSTWSSERAFVIATIAAAVGLGNLWRFPYMAGENGGAAFILAYLAAVLILGVPLMVIELAAGRMERGGPVRTFRHVLGRTGTVIGWLVVVLTIIIMSYYLVITGWTLAYAVGSLTGPIKPFSDFLAGYDSLLYFLIVCVLTVWVVSKSINAIEVFAMILMPLLALIVLVLTLYSLTLEGAPEALSFLFQPDVRKFLSPTIWLFAFGQAFYSLAVGQGYLITYGSFLPEKINLLRSSLVVAGVETAFALIAGLMMFPIVFTIGADPAEGTRLAFEILPHSFDIIPFGEYLGAAFFLLFFLAAFSSCVAGMQVVKTAFKEELDVSNPIAALVSFSFIFPLGSLAALSFSPLDLTLLSRPFLEVLDMFAANQVVIISAIAGGALIGWLVPMDQLASSMGVESSRVTRWTVWVARYMAVPIVVVALITFLF